MKHRPTMSRTTSVDRCEEKSDITRVFLKDGVSFDLPLLVMHKERKIVGELFKRFSLGTCIQHEIIFGGTCPPSGDLVLQGEILHVNGCDIIGSAGGLIVRFRNFNERELVEPETLFSIVLNFL